MQIQHIGGFDTATRVTGPTHNYLAIAWNQDCLAMPAVEVTTLAHAEFHVHDDVDDPRVVAILEGVRVANIRLGTNLQPAIIRFLVDDTPDPSIYQSMAERLVAYAADSRRPSESSCHVPAQR